MRHMPITQLKCDMHTHTLRSEHAYSTISENIGEASAIGLELLGSTDHFGAGFLRIEPTRPGELVRSYQFWTNLGTWPRTWHGVRLMHGCEADIVDIEGHLFGHDVMVDAHGDGTPDECPDTLKNFVFSRSDYVIASLHSPAFTRTTSALENTKMYINALQDPKVLFLGHIGRMGIDFDIDAVVGAARDLHKMIEINEHTFDSTDGRRCARIAARCAELGCKIVVSTDAHICCTIGRFSEAIAMLNDIGFPQELIASRSCVAFESAMEESGIGSVDWEKGLSHSIM
jgi:putative hydrolase